MMPDSLDVSLHGLPPTMTIELRGDLVSADGDELTDAYREASARGARTVVVDLTNVDLMNSAGISLLIDILTESRKINQRLVLAGVNPHYQRILTMVGLARYAEIFATIDDAGRALDSPSSGATSPG